MRPPLPGMDKVEFRRLCEAALQAFLDGDDRITFGGHSKPTVSVLLVLYNQAPLTLQCLRALKAQAFDALELIIVDNASTDRTQDLLDRLENVRVISNPHNAGFVEAVNQAAAVASGDYLLLLNNDAIVLPGAINHALQVLVDHADAGSVGGRIVQLDGRLQEAGCIIWNDGACGGYGRGDDPRSYRFLFRRSVDFCSGVFLLTPRKLFEGVGGFDTRFSPAYYEEVDYCVRLADRGYRNLYEPACVVLHYEFASSVNAQAAIELQQRNRALFLDKHFHRVERQPCQQRDCVTRARSSNRARMLFVDDRVPHPALGAGYPRCQKLLCELAGLGFEVTFYPLLANADSWRETHATLPPEIEVVSPGGVYDFEYFLRTRSNVYDCLVVSRVHNMHITRDIIGRYRNGRDPILVYDAEAIAASREILKHERSGKHLSSRSKRRILQRELSVAANANVVITVSELEARAFRNAGHEQVEVIGHSMDMPMATTGFDPRRGFLFVGALREDDSPNVDSLQWFVGEVMPALGQELGDEVATLYVVGDRSLPDLDCLDAEGVRYLGRLDSLDEVFERCRIFVAPTRFAAGMPYKVHEAAARGVPCVVTSLLAGQLGWRDGDELLVADSAEAFAAACKRLYRDKVLWNRIRQGARAAAERDCSPQAFSKAVREVFGPFVARTEL